jgi:hypothetical protein
MFTVDRMVERLREELEALATSADIDPAETR